MKEERPIRLPIVEDGLDRRDVLQLIGAGLAWAACEPSRGKILPYSRQPREVVPGRPLVFATTMTERGVAWGVLVRSHAGRPIKADGNPDHPTTLGGGSSPALQASIYDLYDPGRGKRIRKGREASSWVSFVRDLRDVSPGGRGLHFLLRPTSSPLLERHIETIRGSHPEASFHFFDPLRSEGRDEAIRLAFGRTLRQRLHFDAARCVASFDSDFLTDPPERIRLANDFAKTRRVREPGDTMGRLWVAEGEVTVTGSLADERLRARPSAIPSLLAALVAELARAAPVPGLALPPGGAQAPPWIRALAGDLLAHRGASLVVVGERQPTEAHLLGLLANQILGNLGSTLVHGEPILYEEGEDSHSLVPLVRALRAGSVESLVILDGNPAYDAPSDLAFAEAMLLAKRRTYAGLYENQTAALCDWYLPTAHYLEAWGDARAHDGTVSLIQPLVRPLVGGRTPAEILAAFSGDPNPQGEALLRGLYASVPLGDWQAALQWGFFRGAPPPSGGQPRMDAMQRAFGRAAAGGGAKEIEVSLRQDAKIRDGSHSNNAWLVELPDPITGLSWQNVALLSPETARRLGLEEGQLVDIRWDDREVRLPILPLRGMADDVISLSLGWGQRAPVWAGGRATKDEDAGTDVYPLRTMAAPWFLSGATVRKAKGRMFPLTGEHLLFGEIVRAQPERDPQGRTMLLSATLETWERDPAFVRPHGERAPNLYGNPWSFTGPQWAMSIDLGACIGCAACVVACQAENNTPVVGKENVRKGRAMHWLRVDRYYLSSREDTLQYLPQPMLCQHCETAPCEYVCPVNATVHSPDGLNEMVYNRCIGTRFCSNNCPYKVRRFNFFRYNHHLQPETLKMVHNPNVTVRERGVMEKCTYCVQRIRTAQIDARVEGRELRDGDVKTACQVACPTQAIVFGLSSEPSSEVSRLRSLPHSYAALNQELGTEPRTRYLAHLRNPLESA